MLNVEWRFFIKSIAFNISCYFLTAMKIVNLGKTLNNWMRTTLRAGEGIIMNKCDFHEVKTWIWSRTCPILWMIRTFSYLLNLLKMDIYCPCVYHGSCQVYRSKIVRLITFSIIWIVSTFQNRQIFIDYLYLINVHKTDL